MLSAESPQALAAAADRGAGTVLPDSLHRCQRCMSHRAACAQSTRRRRVRSSEALCRPRSVRRADRQSAAAAIRVPDLACVERTFWAFTKPPCHGSNSSSTHSEWPSRAKKAPPLRLRPATARCSGVFPSCACGAVSLCEARRNAHDDARDDARGAHTANRRKGPNAANRGNGVARRVARAAVGVAGQQEPHHSHMTAASCERKRRIASLRAQPARALVSSEARVWGKPAARVPAASCVRSTRSGAVPWRRAPRCLVQRRRAAGRSGATYARHRRTGSPRSSPPTQAQPPPAPSRITREGKEGAALPRDTSRPQVRGAHQRARLTWLGGWSCFPTPSRARCALQCGGGACRACHRGPRCRLRARSSPAPRSLRVRSGPRLPSSTRCRSKHIWRRCSVAASRREPPRTAARCGAALPAAAGTSCSARCG